MNNGFVGCDSSVKEGKETVSGTFFKYSEEKHNINCNTLSQNVWTLQQQI